MISTVIIEPDRAVQNGLQASLHTHCSFLSLAGTANSASQAFHLLKKTRPDLLFFNPCLKGQEAAGISGEIASGKFATIFICNEDGHAQEAIQLGATGYLLQPLNVQELILAVNDSLNRIFSRGNDRLSPRPESKASRYQPSGELLGIPTMDGYEFLAIADIVRCEGLQKCTRVITGTRSNIVSSYNLGEFCRILEPHGFFAIHKSHLVNLNKILRYCRSGYITMQDGSHVPLARRRRKEFLELVVPF